MDRGAHRRRFLTFLASSPLLACGVPEWLAGFADAADAQSDLPKRASIATPNEALNVCDFASAICSAGLHCPSPSRPGPSRASSSGCSRQAGG